MRNSKEIVDYLKFQISKSVPFHNPKYVYFNNRKWNILEKVLENYGIDDFITEKFDWNFNKSYTHKVEETKKFLYSFESKDKLNFILSYISENFHWGSVKTNTILFLIRRGKWENYFV